MNWNNITIEKLQAINMQVTDKNGYSALHHLSARNTNTKTLQSAIDNGADVNKVDGQGHTPLHHATIKNTNPDIAILLIDNGADVTIKDNNGKTAIETAEYNKNFRNKMQRKIKKYLNPKKEKAMEKQYAGNSAQQRLADRKNNEWDRGR